MQTKMEQQNTAVVLNMDQIYEKRSSSSSNSVSISTDKPPKVSNIDDLSLALTDVPEEHHDDNISLTLDDVNKPNAGFLNDADSAAFSESANSSANFSFMNESIGPNYTDASYPALYAPEKQREYEENKELEERKNKYGMFHHFAPMLDFVSIGVNKVYDSFTTIILDGICGGGKGTQS